MAEIKKKSTTKKSSTAKASTAKKSTAAKATKKVAHKKSATKAKEPAKKAEKKSTHVSEKVKANKSRAWIVTAIVLAVAIILLAFGIGYILMNNTDDNSIPVKENITTNSSTIELLILEDPTCTNCQVDVFADQVKANLIPELSIRKVSVESQEGKKLLSDLNLNQVPAYLFSNNIDKREDWTEQLSPAFIPTTIDGVAVYMLNPQYVPNKVMIEEPKILEGAIVYGNADAPVTIYEFSDYECPFCAIAEGNEVLVEQFQSRAPGYVAPMPKVFEEYIDTGKVKLVFYNMPLEQLHPKVMPAHLAAMCANEQDMWLEFHHKLFSDREDWTESSDYVTKMKDYAAEFGLDTVAFNECLDSKKYESQINTELAYGQSLGVSGTPAFFIGKNFLSGAQEYDVFKSLIDAELAKVSE